MTLPSLQVAVPVLETERLCLRGYRQDDLDASAALWADPMVTRHIGEPRTREETWVRLLRHIGHWTAMGFGFWAVEERASGRLIGELGFANFKRDIDPPIGDAPEAGWVLASAAHGSGLATEGVGAATRWGDAHFGGGRTVCIIAPENAGSLRVAAKCGYREFGHATYRGHSTILLER